MRITVQLSEERVRLLGERAERVRALELSRIDELLLLEDYKRQHPSDKIKTAKDLRTEMHKRAGIMASLEEINHKLVDLQALEMAVTSRNILNQVVQRQQVEAQQEFTSIQEKARRLDQLVDEQRKAEAPLASTTEHQCTGQCASYQTPQPVKKIEVIYDVGGEEPEETGVEFREVPSEREGTRRFDMVIPD